MNDFKKIRRPTPNEVVPFSQVDLASSKPRCDDEEEDQIWKANINTPCQLWHNGNLAKNPYVSVCGIWFVNVCDILWWFVPFT